MPQGQVTLTVSKGWVTLEGEFEWQYQKQAAERAVRYLIGVVGVINAIVVKAAHFALGVETQNRRGFSAERRIERAS